MLDTLEIRTLDSVWSVCNEVAANNIRDLLTYEYVIWVPGRFGKKKLKTKGYLLDARKRDEHYFFTGFVPKCLDYLDGHGIEYDYKSDVPVMEFDEPHIEGIEFRPYQTDLIWNAIDAGRGVIKSPTGSGKSIIIMGIMSAFSQEHILFLVHTTDLVYQMKSELEKYGNDVGVWTGKDKIIKRITVATVQSYKKVAREYVTHWDVVFVDEGHHISKVDSGNYYQALTLIGAPCKFALTATLPDSQEGMMALEGLIGPVIGELTMAEGADLGFLAKPNIIMYEHDLPDDLIDVKSFQQAYSKGIVYNCARNARICAEAEMEMDAGGTVLILVTRIEHINQIQQSMDIPVEVVRGAVSKDERLRIKEELISGKVQCVIATVAWVEGVDIPTLTCVINAGGMKSETQTLQKIGRGMRKTKKKTTVKIIDFMDHGNKHLLRHSKQRRGIYQSQGWEVNLK